MRLPTWISVVCRADGTPLVGAMVNLTIKVRHKNDFNVAVGPTDERGAALITLLEMEASAQMDLAAFPMDYTGLADFSGELVIAAETRESLRRAHEGYARYHRFFRYPPGYAAKLQEAERVLDGIAPATLSLEVEHDGEGIIVRTLDVAA